MGTSLGRRSEGRKVGSLYGSSRRRCIPNLGEVHSHSPPLRPSRAQRRALRWVLHQTTQSTSARCGPALRIGRASRNPNWGEVRSCQTRLPPEPRRGSQPQPTVAPEQRAAPGATVGFESNRPINLGEVVARRCESAGAWRNLNWGEVRSLSHQLLPEPRRGSQPQPTVAPEQRAAPGATVGFASNHPINLGEVVARRCESAGLRGTRIGARSDPVKPVFRPNLGGVHSHSPPLRPNRAQRRALRWVLNQTTQSTSARLWPAAANRPGLGGT